MQRMKIGALAALAILLAGAASALSARANDQVQLPTPQAPSTLTAPADTTGCDAEDGEEDDDDREEVQGAEKTGVEMKAKQDDDEHEHHCGNDDDGEEDDAASPLVAAAAHKA